MWNDNFESFMEQEDVTQYTKQNEEDKAKDADGEWVASNPIPKWKGSLSRRSNEDVMLAWRKARNQNMWDAGAKWIEKNPERSAASN